jgi:hypothetical protein
VVKDKQFHDPVKNGTNSDFFTRNCLPQNLGRLSLEELVYSLKAWSTNVGVGEKIPSGS